MQGVYQPLAERFWQFVEKTDGCWLWTGYTSSGYGRIGGESPQRQMLRAHRVAWELLRGPIPPRTCVLHRCDVRRCVNPDHLFLGTYRDNIHDARDKNRLVIPSPQLAPRGEQNGQAKLTADQVRVIRSRAAAGEKQSALAQEFGIQQPQVSDIVRRKKWRHVTD